MIEHYSNNFQFGLLFSIELGFHYPTWSPSNSIILFFFLNFSSTQQLPGSRLPFNYRAAEYTSIYLRLIISNATNFTTSNSFHSSPSIQKLNIRTRYSCLSKKSPPDIADCFHIIINLDKILLNVLNVSKMLSK